MGILSHFLSSKTELSFKNPKQFPAARIEDDLKVGLQTLIHSEPKQPPPHAPHIVHSYTVSTAWKPLPPSSSSMFRSRVMDDVIGTESGDYMSSNLEDLKGVMDRAEPHCNRGRSRYKSAKTREFPPPISLLEQTGGMPWVFKRENIDGRLIIRAERVKRHEYFEAHRQNGRLTMKLVPAVDDNVYCEDCGHPITDEELEDDADVEGGAEQEEWGSEGSWFQKSPMKQETEESEDLRKCIGYDDGLVQDSDPFWKGKGIEGPSGYLGGPGSTLLRPMTTVK